MKGAPQKVDFGYRDGVFRSLTRSSLNLYKRPNLTITLLKVSCLPMSPKVSRLSSWWKLLLLLLPSYFLVYLHGFQKLSLSSSVSLAGDCPLIQNSIKANSKALGLLDINEKNIEINVIKKTRRNWPKIENFSHLEIPVNRMKVGLCLPYPIRRIPTQNLDFRHFFSLFSPKLSLYSQGAEFGAVTSHAHDSSIERKK